jgi:hypothetical protein
VVPTRTCSPVAAVGAVAVSVFGGDGREDGGADRGIAGSAAETVGGLKDSEGVDACVGALGAGIDGTSAEVEGIGADVVGEFSGLGTFANSAQVNAASNSVVESAIATNTRISWLNLIGAHEEVDVYNSLAVPLVTAEAYL